MGKRGRPIKYTADSRVRLCVTGDSKLQKKSDRRAIINLLVDNGGAMTMIEINEHFGFDISDKVVALIRCDWLEIVNEGAL